jgi:2-polyprenyl-3-methyl-5-hydroxy-6-metoxy-1,4-benzoquinol methylase
MTRQLNSDEWGSIYNIQTAAQSLIDAITRRKFSAWTNELIKVIPSGSSTLEIGSGSGQSSLALAQAGCGVTLLDFGDEQLRLAEYVANKLGLTINTVNHDATKPLPFASQESNKQTKPFDFIFHAGLLEHFEPDKRTELLKLWKAHCRIMISMIPNAASLAYALGKEQQERNGTWQYGKELPSHTQIHEFMLAGYEVTAEYTIGNLSAVAFLDKADPLRQMLKNFWENRYANKLYENFHQGYLVVTIGKNPDCE